jgi:sulfur-oxidizing protein SoxY
MQSQFNSIHLTKEIRMQTRRETLKHSAIVAGLLASTGLFPQFAMAAVDKAAFQAKSVADVLKNPAALVALFNVTDSVEANFATRAKMGQSSDVYAVAVMADGKAFFAKKEVKVTLGGCGG